MRDIIREEARLVILKELYEQTNYASSDSLLQEILPRYGIAKPREWIREEISYLAEIGAVTSVREGSVVIARLLPKGVEHVERRRLLEGVKRPSPIGE